MIFSHGDRNKKEIAITFDDGPSEETLNVLSILKKYNVRATFFVVGKMIKGRKEIIELAKKEGHEIGNHTFSHKKLLFKSKKFIEYDVNRCDDELGNLGIKTNLIRFPELKYGINALSVCRKLKKKIISIDFLSLNQNTYDWYIPWLKKVGLMKTPIQIEDVIKGTIKQTKNGSILGFHDYLQDIGSHPEISLILEKILPELKNKGFKFVTISELLTL
jgi:peptidoglycan/xylan/chitin deacetylase (PgdA/CDA1 family)